MQINTYHRVGEVGGHRGGHLVQPPSHAGQLQTKGLLSTDAEFLSYLDSQIGNAG